MKSFGLSLLLLGMLFIFFGVLVLVDPRTLIILSSALLLFVGSVLLISGIGVWKFQHRMFRVRERFVGMWRG